MRGYTHRFRKARKKMLLIMSPAGLGCEVLAALQCRVPHDELVPPGPWYIKKLYLFVVKNERLIQVDGQLGDQT